MARARTPDNARIAALEQQVRDLLAAQTQALSGRPDVFAGAFPAQRAYAEDQSMLKWALCTRRAAKTFSVGLEYLKDSETHPGAKYIFLGISREAARNQFWEDVLKAIDDRFEYGLRFNESRLVATTPNGARIHLVGADANEKEKRKQLGGKNRKVTIDEAQDWNVDLRKMVHDVLLPTVADLGGSVAMIGTPGLNTSSSFFYHCTRGSRAGYVSPPEMREPGWSGHAWQTRDNPYMRDEIAAQIAKLVAMNPRIVETPGFRRQYLGEWVIDLEARVYKYDPERNVFRDLPKYPVGAWHYVLGVDLGYFPDPSAFTLCAYHDHDPCLYIVKTWKQWRMDITDVAERTRWFFRMVEEGTAAAGPAETIEYLVIDGANAQAVAEIRNRHNLPFQAADKRGKSDFIEIMNAELILGNIKIDPDECADGEQNDLDPEAIASGKPHESLSLADEWTDLIWDPNAPPGKREEHPGCANHLADAALYSWRYCYTYLSRPAPTPPPPAGSAAWAEHEAARMFEAEVEEVLERRELEEEPFENPDDFHSMPDADRDRLARAVAAAEGASDNDDEMPR